MPPRRNILVAAPAVFAVPVARAADTEPARLDLSTPGAQVLAFVKLLASLENATLYHLYKGTMEAVIPGQAPVRLVDSTTIIRRQVERRPEGHHISIWEATVYHRPGEFEPLDAFVNPLNGRTVRPFHQREGRGESLWADDGPRVLRNGTWTSNKRTGQPFSLEWSQMDGRIWTSRYNSGVYVKHPLDPVKWPLEYCGPDLLYSEKTTNSGFVRDVADPSVVNAAATYSVSQVMLWWPWLLMGQQPGHLLWNTNGVKLSSPEMIPTEVRAMVEKVHPTILGAAVPWEGRVNLWTDYPKMRTPEKV